MSEQSIDNAERHFGVRLPLALRDYHLGVGNLHTFNKAHNRLLPPKDWFLDGGKLVFMVENQAVVYWGVTAEQSPNDDPPVFQGVNCLPKLIEWHLEHEPCSEWLLIMLHWQAVCGGLEWLGMVDVGEDVVQHFRRNWQIVGEQEGMIAFRQEGRAACFIGEADAQELFVGTNSKELFAIARAELRAIGVGLNQI
jgi:hypothetical protein